MSSSKDHQPANSAHALLTHEVGEPVPRPLFLGHRFHAVQSLADQISPH